MKLLEIVARTFSPQLQDGRFIFRPWGARGPCYLLSQRQRSVRAWFQLSFYVLALATFWFLPGIVASASGLITFAVAFVLLNYVLFLLLSIGLPKTDKPPTPTPLHQRTAMAAHSRELGRPLLCVLAVVSCLFALVGGAAALLLHKWATGLLGLVVFGTFAALFIRQLWLIRGQSDA